jgi:eukaryotic-like serine/threonine-protein kinase
MPPSDKTALPADPRGDPPSHDGAESAAADVVTPVADAARQPTHAIPPTPPAHSAAPSFAAGMLVAERYRIVRFIAAGGMGEVYEAEDTVLGAEVALKTIRAEVALRGAAVERFRREILLARKVTHPNVCRIFDVGHHPADPTGSGPGVTFLSMELLRGETLDRRLRKGGAMPTGEALPLALQMAAGLQAAHDAGVVHRDFKSANVMLIPPRSAETAPRVVVTDFGLARAGVGTDLDTITRTDHVIGTPAYMAPEQVDGGEVTSAADIYALGVVLYEMVTGRRPFEGDSPLSTVLKRFREDPASPRDHVPGLDERWERVILRCLERAPADRFASADEVARALRGETVASGRRRRRLRAVAAATAAVLAFAGAFALVMRSPMLREGSRAPSSPAAVAARRSVAVLGFKNLSGSPETAWLSTALAEMLAGELSAGATVRVLPGESVARMKKDLGLSDAEGLAADSLARVRSHSGADVVVLGSYLAVGDGAARRIRVDLRLQETAAGETLASITETGTEQGVLDLVSRTGERLRQGLGARGLSAGDAGALRASRPANAEAARLYAEGIAKLRTFDALAARPLLEKAVAADPAYAPAHAALAEAWSALGFDARAADAARAAFERAESFSREERLAIEGRYREATKDWPRAVEVYRTLWTFFPDELEYGLRLAAAHTAAGQGQEARATIAALRRLPPPLSDDPRVDLADAVAAESVSDFKAQRDLAARAAAKAGDRGASQLVARARLSEGTALRYLGRQSECAAASAEARRLFEAAGDRAGVANALLLDSNRLVDAGDLPAARRAAEEALAIRREIGDENGTARSLTTLANVLDSQGEFAASRTTRERSLAVFRKVGNRYGVALGTFNLANLLAKLGDHDGALARYEEALAGFREVGNRMGIAAATTGVANEKKERGDLAAAKRLYGEALAVDRETGDVVAQSICHANLGAVALLLGDLGEAEREYGETRRTAAEAGNKSLTGVALTGLAEILVRRGHLEEARQRHQEALALRTEIGEEREAAESRFYLGVLAVESGRAKDAEAEARALPELFRRLQAPEYEAYARTLLARVLVETGEPRAARQEIERATAAAGSTASPELRFTLAVARGRVLAGSGDAAPASAHLASTAREARKAGLAGFALEAEMVLGEVEARTGGSDAGRARLRAVEAEARSKGYGLIASRAAAVAQGLPAGRPAGGGSS